MWPERTGRYLGAQPLRSYRELRDRVAALAAGLTGLGCRVGDRVAVVMDNRPEYLEILFAAWWAGLAVVPVNAKLHPGEVAWILQDSDARLIVTDQAHVAGLRGVIEADPAETKLLVADSAQYSALASVAAGAVRPCAKAKVSDLAWLFYTSGTTGRPKGVMLGHRQLLAMTLSYHAQIDAVGPDDRTVYAAPMSHGAGIYSPVFMLHGSGHVFRPAADSTLQRSATSPRRWGTCRSSPHPPSSTGSPPTSPRPVRVSKAPRRSGRSSTAAARCTSTT